MHQGHLEGSVMTWAFPRTTYHQHQHHHHHHQQQNHFHHQQHRRNQDRSRRRTPFLLHLLKPPSIYQSSSTRLAFHSTSAYWPRMGLSCLRIFSSWATLVSRRQASNCWDTGVGSSVKRGNIESKLVRQIN